MVEQQYKCIEPTFPRAINAIFLKDGKGDFELKAMLKDDEYKSPGGYNLGGFGDSGSPLWNTTYPAGANRPDSGEQRHAVIAVYTLGAGLASVSITGIQDKCADMATKVTSDIIAWIKKANEETPIEAFQADTSQ